MESFLAGVPMGRSAGPRRSAPSPSIRASDASRYVRHRWRISAQAAPRTAPEWYQDAAALTSSWGVNGGREPAVFVATREYIGKCFSKGATQRSLVKERPLFRIDTASRGRTGCANAGAAQFALNAGHRDAEAYGGRDAWPGSGASKLSTAAWGVSFPSAIAE
jgi:hypothetical protein